MDCWLTFLNSCNDSSCSPKNLNTQDNLNFPEQEIILEEIDELDSLPTE